MANNMIADTATHRRRKQPKSKILHQRRRHRQSGPKPSHRQRTSRRTRRRMHEDKYDNPNEIILPDEISGELCNIMSYVPPRKTEICDGFIKCCAKFVKNIIAFFMSC
jgi:hypothetical protein